MANVLLISDSTMSRLGFQSLTAEADHRVDCADAADRAVDQARSQTYDVIVVDEPETAKTIVLCEALTAACPSTPVMVLASTFTGTFVRAVIESGARSMVGKDQDADRVRAAISSVASGQAVLDPRATNVVLDWIADDADGRDLSDREIDVLRLVCAGESNKIIARDLGLTENTVKTYLKRCYRKLGCKTRSAAAAAAIRKGWV